MVLAYWILYSAAYVCGSKQIWQDIEEESALAAGACV